ncbi:hypothetical protein FQR65_LT18015 [Abscondita terminalis]|nr:hypothetical protein FQR65_LT18015 [Abscondita terminalis]
MCGFFGCTADSGEKENLIQNAHEIGDYLVEQVKDLPKVKEVRSVGLMTGIELEMPCAEVRNNLLWKHKILTGKMHPIKNPQNFAVIIEKFTVGNDRDFDLLLAEYDIKGNLAHAEMLSRVGLLDESEWKLVEKELLIMLEEVKKGNFTIKDGVEDVHSQVEFNLTQKIGDAGKKIHSARSRNDQVLVDIKLYLKDEIKEIAKFSEQLFGTLQSLSEAHKDKLIPGYTHLQIAMPSSFGLWFGAYAEALTDDLELLVAAYNVLQ